MPKWAVGVGEVVAGIATLGSSNAILEAISVPLLLSGAQTIVAGTLAPKGPLAGVATSARNPIAPWNVIYGRARVGGTIIFINEFDEDNKYLDLVIVLACHPCQNVDQLFVDGNYVPIDPATRCSYTRDTDTYQYGDGDHGSRGHTTYTEFSRVAGVVTVTVNNSHGTGIGTYLQMGDGDKIKVTNMPNVPDLLSLEGTFPIIVNPLNANQFFYICPGNDTDAVNAGHMTTVFAGYKSKIYMENLLGTQTLGQTFNGMINGTPYDGDTGNLVVNPSNPWTANHSLVGMTATFLRLHYNKEIWANGIPSLTFALSGKNDIYDPRTGATGYTDNAALCTADYLAHPIWGFKLAYGTDIPNTPLTAAANICDATHALAAGGSEKTYTVNGAFPLTMKRGEVLQNLLTACGGRITTSGGQWVIWPAAWPGVAGAAIDLKTIATGPIRWNPKLGSRDLFNGVKGTYISPVNNWQSSDFPRYAQDVAHGYTSDNNLAQDGGDRRWLDIQLPFTISASMAQRLAKIELLRRRYQGNGTFAMNMSAYKLATLDVWPFTMSALGWSAKQFEILQNRLTFDRVSLEDSHEATLLGTQVDVQEADVSIYDWSTTEELSPQGYRQAQLPQNRNLAAPANLVLTSDNTTVLLQGSGVVLSRILATWTDPSDGFFTEGGHIEIQYQQVASPANPWESLQSVLPGVQQIYIGGVHDGEQYLVQIRAVNTAGVPSDWVQAGPVTVESRVTVYGSNGGSTWPVAGDAIYGQAMFGLVVSSSPNSDGTVTVTATASPDVPATVYSTAIDAPILDTAVTQSSTGGSIPGGQTVFIAIAALDSSNNFTKLSDVIPVTIPSGTNTNQITLTITNYAAGMALYEIYVGSTAVGLYYRRNNSAGATLTLTSLATVSGTSYPIPDPNFSSFAIAVTRILLNGIFGGTADAISTITAVVPSSGNHYQLTLSGAVFTPSAMIGRVISTIVQGPAGNPTPLQDYTVTANDATSVTVVAPPATGLFFGPTFNNGDQVVIRLQPTTFTSTTIGDSMLAMTTDQYKGKVVTVIYPDGSNQTVYVLSNDATTFTVDAAFWGPTPKLWWIEDSSSGSLFPCPPPTASSTGAAVDLMAPLYNQPSFQAVRVFAQDVNGNLSPAPYSPVRDCFWAGDPGTGVAGGYNPEF